MRCPRRCGSSRACSVGVRPHRSSPAATSARHVPVGPHAGRAGRDDRRSRLCAAACRGPGAWSRPTAALRAGAWTWERRWDPEGFARPGRSRRDPRRDRSRCDRAGGGEACAAASACACWAGRAPADAVARGGGGTCLEELLCGSRIFVSVHVALTPDTHETAGSPRAPSGRMKSRRAADQQRRGEESSTRRALAAALHSGATRRCGARCLRAASRSSPPIARCLRAPNLVLTPHIGSASIGHSRDTHGRACRRQPARRSRGPRASPLRQSAGAAIGGARPACIVGARVLTP